MIDGCEYRGRPSRTIPTKCQALCVPGVNLSHIASVLESNDLQMRCARFPWLPPKLNSSKRTTAALVAAISSVVVPLVRTQGQRDTRIPAQDGTLYSWSSTIGLPPAKLRSMRSGADFRELVA
jgi:hypothetical protein